MIRLKKGKVDGVMLVKRKAGVWGKIVGGKWCLLEDNKEYIRELSGVGSRIWSLLDKPRSQDYLVKRICEEFDVDQVDAKRDVEQFIAECVKDGFLVLID